MEFQHIHIVNGSAGITEAALGGHLTDLVATEVDEGVAEGCGQVSAHVL